MSSSRVRGLEAPTSTSCWAATRPRPFQRCKAGSWYRDVIMFCTLLQDNLPLYSKIFQEFLQFKQLAPPRPPVSRALPTVPRSTSRPCKALDVVLRCSRGALENTTMFAYGICISISFWYTNSDINFGNWNAKWKVLPACYQPSSLALEMLRLHSAHSPQDSRQPSSWKNISSVAVVVIV